MKNLFVPGIALVLMLSACLPTASQQPAAATLAPVSEPNVQATVEVSVQQTLQSLPTPTLAPSNTPVMVTATQAATQTPQSTSTETQNPILLTLTATLGTGTAVTSTPGTPGTLQPTATSVVNVNPAFSATVTETPHLQYYGTMPPFLAYSNITLNNKSKSEVYISLQCTTSEGYKTIIEYPVSGQIKTNAPVGKYIYVAWVGGRQFTGKFALGDGKDLVINIFKDHLEIK